MGRHQPTLREPRFGSVKVGPEIEFRVGLSAESETSRDGRVRESLLALSFGGQTRTNIGLLHKQKRLKESRTNLKPNTPIPKTCATFNATRA